MANNSSLNRAKSGGPDRLLRWLTHRRVIANMIWLVSASKTGDFPPKPDNENLFSKPVAWLLGRQVISALKWILLSAAYQGRLDSRNWMKPNVVSFADYNGKDFWFDYLADSGDGQKAMYSIAYLCLSDLWIETPANKSLIGSNVKLKERPANLHLPRGEFLFVGGDTAYHIADYPTLAYRFQLPFHWAAVDLGIKDSSRRRPLFGIPGNHDYYDEIEGFHRQFRAPITPEDVRTKKTPTQVPRLPQLRIPSFRRCQEASYVAIELPYQWWMWGLDSESGDLGTRQREFFKKFGNPPSKLIVATSKPTTFLGRYLSDDSSLAKVFQDLGLPRPFLEVPEPLPANSCRLDLAGDIHRYARYWGPPAPESPVDTPFYDNYSSVVSGLGGAVVHPWAWGPPDIAEQVLYPTKGVSRMEVARNLLNPIKLATGGGLWLVGALLAIIIFFGATLPPNSKSAVDTLVLRSLGVDREVRLGITSPFWPLAGKLTRTVGPVASNASIEAFRRSLWILGSFLPLVLGVIFATLYSKYLKAQVKDRQVMSWEYWPLWVVYGFGLILPVLALMDYGSEPAKQVVSDIVFVIVVAGTFLGLTYLAVGVGAKTLPWESKVIFLLLGISHASVQLALPFLLMRLAGPVELLLVLAVMAAFFGLGLFLTQMNAPKWLFLIAWLAYAAVAIWLPIRFSAGLAQVPHGWLIPGYFLIVGLVGMVNLSVWFGWYLLVSLAFSGHNDEASGATRIERYKQFIRFHLTAEKLTGYVIAIDEPKIDGRELQPKIIDVFTIQP